MYFRHVIPTEGWTKGQVGARSPRGGMDKLMRGVPVEEWSHIREHCPSRPMEAWTCWHVHRPIGRMDTLVHFVTAEEWTGWWTSSHGPKKY